MILCFSSRFGRLAVMVLAAGWLVSPVWGGVVAQWQFDGQNGTQMETEASDVALSGVTASAIVRGEGLSAPKGSAYTLDGMGFLSSPEVVTMEQAVAKQAYFEITLTPKSGQTVTVGSLVLGSKIPTRKWGPLSFVVRSSVDEFATDCGGVNTTTAGDEGGDVVVALDEAIQKVPGPVTLRFYCYGSSMRGKQNGLWVIGNSAATGGMTLFEEGSPDMAKLEATRNAEQEARPKVTMEEQLKAVAGNAEVVRYAEARRKLAADPYRPSYHFVAPDGLLNDPNGLCQWQGKYHMFYQLRPANGVFHWAHAYSDDLVHWKDLPMAIGPTIEKQVYSGQTLVEKDRVIAMYHGTKSGNFIATSDDPLLLTWKKLPGNPVIPLAQKDTQGRDIRIFDPDIWKKGDRYYSVSGTYDEGTRGPGKDAKMVQHLFHSEDLKKWDYVGPLVEGRAWTDPGEDGAVPKLLPIGKGKHILFFFSHARAAQYLVGTYDEGTHRFTPESHGRFNFGPWLKGSLHAPGAFIDEAGRMIAIFNMRENMISAAQPEHGIVANEWYGMMTLPRQLWLDEQNRLRMKPMPELEALRGERVKVEAREIPANESVLLEGVAGKELELDATFLSGGAREYGLEVLRSPDGREKTVITVYKDAGGEGIHHVGIDVAEASLRPDVAARPPEIAPAAVGKDTPVRLRVFVDRSIVEVFVNEVQALAVRVYPQEAQSQGVAVFSRGGATKLASLEAWKMKSAGP